MMSQERIRRKQWETTNKQMGQRMPEKDRKDESKEVDNEKWLKVALIFRFDEKARKNNDNAQKREKK